MTLEIDQPPGAKDLPNLVVIGAAKAGTTSLHHYLDQHPQIAMSSPKELRFFNRDDWRDRIDWYRSCFAGDAAIRGESSPAYAIYPSRGDAAAHMHELIPHARLVYVVRDPVDRTVSHWAQARADSARRSYSDPVPRQTLEEAIREAEAPENAIVWASRYATQLERFLARYDAAQIRVLDYDELRTDRNATMRGIFEFLGVNADVDAGIFEAELNTRADKRELTGIGAPLWNYLLQPLGSRVPRSRHGPLAASLRRLVERRVEAPADAAELVRDRLGPLLSREADRLRELTGQRFAGWSL